MNLSERYLQQRTGVANILAVSNGTRLASGSGFLANGKLVTCAHVIRQVPPTAHLVVSFEHSPEGQDPSFTFTPGTIAQQIRGWSDEQSYDYAIVELPMQLAGRYQFGFATETSISPGSSVYALGYPFEDPQLTIHSGIASAMFRSGVVNMIKLDMSVNPSNSGGPLLSTESGAVIGVIARKHTGLSAQFDALIHSFDQNIQALNGLAGGVRISGIDPLSAMAGAQAQMRQLSLEIKRSANVGTGYAISVDVLATEAALVP